VSEDPPARGFFQQRWEANLRPVTSLWAARRRLASAVRLVIERLTVSAAPRNEIEEAASRLEEYAAHLATHPRRQRYVGFSESALASEATEDEEAQGGGHFDYSPLIGRSNPLAPPIEISSDDDGTVHARATFGSAYEGPPGCVHGGYIAAAFDEVLGYAETFSGAPGMTGTLTTIYRRPTPLHTEITFTAKMDRIEGRKIFVTGTLHAGETLCAEANAIFVSMRPGRYLELMKEREERGHG
jgi:acyl-coenzyme A thioesterase PaaI-like protein